MINKIILFLFLTFLIQNVNSQTTGDFKNEKFPVQLIDSLIIEKRGLQESIKMLSEECNWSKRVGKKIDVFWLQTEQGNFFGHVYEYFLDCDNLRLIYWYEGQNTSKIVDFMIEDLEDESLFVVAKKRHLKNKKKYKKYLNKE
jgi:hypothetical protein